MQPVLSATPAALTVELPFSAVAQGQRPPAPLPREQTEGLASAVAADLQRALGDDLYDCGLVIVGALYDLTELLQPGLPMADALTQVYQESLGGGEFVPNIISIGGHAGRFPIPEIAPRRIPGSGPLLCLPIVIVGPPDALNRVATLAEEKLLHSGQADYDSSVRIRDQFGVQPENLTYATFNDLCALMKIQLEHGGFGGLWSLIEHVLFQRDGEETIRLPEGNEFLATSNAVRTPFLSMRQWLERRDGNVADPVTGYLEWLRRQRQYTAGLDAHGIQVHWQQGNADLESGELLEDQNEYREIRIERAGGDASVVHLTEHADPDTGPVAFTAMVQAHDGAVLTLEHDYPLAQTAIEAIRERWRQEAERLGAHFHLAQPRRVAFDAEHGDLGPFLDAGETSH